MALAAALHSSSVVMMVVSKCAWVGDVVIFVIRTLSTAVGDAEVARAGVGGVRTGVVLDGAAALESGARVHKCSTVDREGAVRAAVVNNGRGGSSEVASEGLDVVARGGGLGVVSLALAADATPGTAF